MPEPLTAIDLLTPDDAAVMLGVARSTLADWRIRGTGSKYRKLGRRVLYPRAELVAWVEAQPLVGSSSEFRPTGAGPIPTPEPAMPASAPARRQAA